MISHQQLFGSNEPEVDHSIIHNNELPTAAIFPANIYSHYYNTIPTMDELVDNIVSINITAIGDCTLGNDSRFLYKTSFNYKYDQCDDNGYNWFFSDVRPIFEQDDLTIANLEGVLTSRQKKAPKKYSDNTFHFRGRPEYALMLKEGGVDALNLANNHSLDYMIDGYNDTVKNLDENGLVSFDEDRTPILLLKGVSIGLLGFNEVNHTNEGKSISELKKKVETDIRNIKGKADITVVSFHWGEEKSTLPNQNQIELGRAAIDAGADLVLGHHPHVIQPIEKYRGKYIVYSLGNFCYGGHPNPDDKDTLIFQQTFLVNKEIDWLGTNEPIIYPCSISSTYLYNDYKPTLLNYNESVRLTERIINK